MSLKAWIVVALSLLLLGCHATSLMIGVSEPSLANIQLGDNRSKAEWILGKPLWRVGVADGLTYDIYQYPVARSAQPVLGAAGLVIDAFSLGMLGLTSDPEEFEPVKQIGVAFDGEDRVRFVSMPWMVSYPGACKRMRSNLPLNSGIPTTVKPIPRANTINSSSTLATLELVSPTHAKLDGRGVDGPVIEISAGRHTLSYYEFGNKSGFDFTVVLDVEFLPGRIYRLDSKTFSSYTHVAWVEDVDSGEVLQCSQHVSRRKRK